MTRWQDYEEKLEKVSGNDELIINSGGIVKRVQAIQFRGEQGIRGIGISRIESRKTGKNTFVEVFNTENVKIGSFTIQDGVDGNDGENGADGTDGENGVGIVNISSTKSGKITTLRIELSNGKNYEFNIQDGMDGTGTGDMLKSENLAGLGNIEEARRNLNVYSKSQTDSKITSEILKIDKFILKEEGRGLTEQNFTLVEKNKLENLENFSKDYNDLRNKPYIPSDNNLVHKFGNELLSGKKKFSDLTNFEGGISVSNRTDDFAGVFNSPNSISIGDNDTGFLSPADGQLEAYINGTKVFRTQDGWFEFNKQVTTTQTTPLWDHSLVTKGFVENLISNFSKIVWQTENITSNSAHQEFIHNLNIMQEEFFKGRYIFYAFYQDGGSLRILNSFSNYAQRNGYSGDNSIGVYTNKVQFFARYIGTLRKVLIIKNY